MTPLRLGIAAGVTTFLVLCTIEVVRAYVKSVREYNRFWGPLFDLSLVVGIAVPIVAGLWLWAWPN